MVTARLLPAPVCAKVPSPVLPRLTVSPVTTPTKVAPVTAAAAVPSYVLFWATAPETVSACAASVKVRVTGVAAS